MIYLDHAATTPLAEPVWQAMLPWLAPDGCHANPASDHAPGRAARAAVEAAREEVAALIGAQPDEIVFTSGATESNNLAIKGAVEFHAGEGEAQLVASRIEHKSVVDPLRWLQSRGARLGWLEPERDGRLPAETFCAAVNESTLLASLMAVNNETGVINPVAAVAAHCAERGVLFHVDAAQAAGRIVLDMATMPIALLSLSAHKIYGPKGIGALYVRRRPRARVSPLLHGGGHEQGMRSGTLAPHQIVGFGAAARLARQGLAADHAHAAALAARLRQQLADLPGLYWNDGAGQAVPHIVNVSVDGVHGEALRADLHMLALSSGSACSAATREPSYVLRAMGHDDLRAGASLRISTGRGTTAGDIDAAAARIRAAVLRLRGLAPAGAAP